MPVGTRAPTRTQPHRRPQAAHRPQANPSGRPEPVPTVDDVVAVPRRDLGRTIRLLVAFVVAAVLLGVLGAGLSVPSVAAVGRLTSAGDSGFMTLPSTFSAARLPQGSRILAADGSLIATPEDQDRRVVRLDQIAPVMRQACRWSRQSGTTGPCVTGPI